MKHTVNTRFAKSAYGYFLVWGICTSLAITVCTIVDALLVGNLVGSNGLAVCNISTPVFLVYALLGVTLGVGANIHIGHMLGASNVEEANRIFRKLLTMTLVIGGVCLLPLTFRKAFLGFLGAGGALYPLAERYLTVVLWSAPLFVAYHVLSASVRTDSDPGLAAAASAVVIVTNLTLDVFFMKVLNWGILGASTSLCIAEGLGVAVLLTHFLKKRSLLKLRLELPGWTDIRSFVVNGFGVGSANFFQAVVMLVFNTLLLRFGGENGALHVAIYGVIYTISMVPFAFFDGASTALATVTSFFLGESDVPGIYTVLKRALTAAVLFGVVIAGMVAVSAQELVRFFGITDLAATQMAAGALRLFCLSIVFTGINMVVTAFWQAIGRAKQAGVLSVLRNFLMMLIAGLAMISAFGLNGLSMSYLTVELATGLVILGVLCFAPSGKYLKGKCPATGRTFNNNYIIRAESMERISADLEALCDAWEIGMKQAFFINFICEELLLNIIKFGQKDAKKEYYIDIKLMERDGDYVLRIRDNVRQYNPFESSGDEIDAGVLKLIQKKSKFCDYQRKMVFNYLYVIL